MEGTVSTATVERSSESPWDKRGPRAFVEKATCGWVDVCPVSQVREACKGTGRASAKMGRFRGSLTCSGDGRMGEE